MMIPTNGIKSRTTRLVLTEIGKNNRFYLFLHFQGLRTMQRLHPKTAFTSLADSHTIHQQVLEHPSLHSTRTINGQMLDRSTNQDMPMVRLHLVL